MSVIVRDPDTQEIILYTKGADIFVMNNLDDNNNPFYVLKAKEALDKFSKEVSILNYFYLMIL